MFIKKLIKLFTDERGCKIGCDMNGCPCNSCFYSKEKTDFQYICWLILVGLRGDHHGAEILRAIKEELGKEVNKP